MPKSPLSAEELAYFRELLLRKRAELLGDVQHMADEALGRSRQEASGDLSLMPIHMADIGTDNYEKEFTLGLIQSEQNLMAEIEHALARIADGTYGICEATHRPIGRERLRAKPWARYCIAHVRKLEQDGPRRTR